LHPKISSALFELLRFYPAPLKYLTSKVVVSEGSSLCRLSTGSSARKSA
jgi:hypothetical protein